MPFTHDPVLTDATLRISRVAPRPVAGLDKLAVQPTSSASAGAVVAVVVALVVGVVVLR